MIQKIDSVRHFFSLSILFFIIAFGSFGCSTSKSQRKDCHSFGIFTYCEKGSKLVWKEGIDGGLGEIISNDIKINFDHSLAAYPGPQDEEEYFKTTFRNIFYIKYFDSIYVDKKVHKLFRDSVYLVNLKTVPLGSIRSCKACNREAILSFKGRQKPYYYFVTDELKATLNEYEISNDTVNNVIVKTYKGKSKSGAFLKEIGSNKQSPKLSLELVSGDFDTFKKGLLLQNKN
jgi:hypothetical protein